MDLEGQSSPPLPIHDKCTDENDNDAEINTFISFQTSNVISQVLVIQKEVIVHAFCFISIENIIMTVRRYSISSNSMNGNSRKNEILHKPRRYEETVNNNKWAKLHDGSHSRPSSAYSKPDIEKLTNRHSLQEYVSKNR